MENNTCFLIMYLLTVFNIKPIVQSEEGVSVHAPEINF